MTRKINTTDLLAISRIARLNYMTSVRAIPPALLAALRARYRKRQRAKALEKLARLDADLI